MREIKYYVAWDYTEFETANECQAYEMMALKYLSEINDKYSLFDKNMNVFIAPLETLDIEEWLHWLKRAFNKCKFIYRDANLSEEAESFIDNNCGFCMLNEDFNKETGWFEYDIDKYKWAKMDE